MSITVKDMDGNIIDHLYQWDVNRMLKISGVDSYDSVAVHFKNRRAESAYVVEPTIFSGVIEAVIPNELLTHAEDIVAYIYTGTDDDNSFKTVNEIRLPVFARQKPDDYAFEDNVGYIRLGEAVRDIEEARIIVEHGKLKFEKGSGTGNYITTLSAIKGDPGETPVKGIDYFTEEDKAEFLEGMGIDEKYVKPSDGIPENDLSADVTEKLTPSCTSADNGKFLRVVDGAPAWASVPVMEGGDY